VGDAEAVDAMRRHPADFGVGEAKGACARHDESHDRFEGRRFARAVWAQ
jgi:hypothetical protein